MDVIVYRGNICLLVRSGFPWPLSMCLRYASDLANSCSPKRSSNAVSTCSTRILICTWTWFQNLRFSRS